MSYGVPHMVRSVTVVAEKAKYGYWTCATMHTQTGFGFILRPPNHRELIMKHGGIKDKPITTTLDTVYCEITYYKKKHHFWQAKNIPYLCTDIKNTDWCPTVAMPGPLLINDLGIPKNGYYEVRWEVPSIKLTNKLPKLNFKIDFAEDLS